MRRDHFANRIEAGERLGAELVERGVCAGALVLGLPRGGVPVGYAVARTIGGELDVMPVRKLGMPGHAELAIGAVAEGGHRVLNERMVESAGLTEEMIAEAVERAARELERQAARFRGDRAPVDMSGRRVVLVDDGLATGASMRAATAAARGEGASSVVVGAPVASPEAVELLAREADEVAAVLTPRGFSAVGAWYDDFAQVSDDAVVDCLNRARRLSGG